MYFLLAIKAEQGKPDSNFDSKAQCCETIMWIYFIWGMEDDSASVLFVSLKRRRKNVKGVGEKEGEKINWRCEIWDTPTQSAISLLEKLKAV